MEKLAQLYKQWKGAEPVTVEALPEAGSNRRYFRLTDGTGISVIGVIGTSRDENHTFVYLTRHFTDRRLPVPHILAVSDDELRYLQTDLGHTSLFEALRGGRESGGRYNQHEKQLLTAVIRELPNIQMRGARGLDWTVCYPQAEFDVDSVLFDLNYFKYCFLKATELDFHELKLEANFRLFAKDLTQEHSESFLYRDFQARNVMLGKVPSTTTWLPSFGKPLPNTPSNCAASWSTNTTTLSNTTPKYPLCATLSSGSASSSSSALYKYSEPTASVATSNTNVTSSIVSPRR